MKTLKLSVICLLTVAFSLLIPVSQAKAEVMIVEANQVNITVNQVKVAVKGENITLESGEKTPYSIKYKNTVYLPLRQVCELLNRDVHWDNDTATISITNAKESKPPVATTATAKSGTNMLLDTDANTIGININKMPMVKANESYVLDNGATIPYSLMVNGTTYLPMRQICLLNGKSINWDNATQTVIIKDYTEVKCYKDTQIPDLGAFIAVTEVQKTEYDQELGIISDHYPLTPYISSSLDSYMGLLFDKGFVFEYSDTTTIESTKLYSNAFLNETSNIRVILTTAKSDKDNALEISIVKAEEHPAKEDTKPTK